MRELVDEEREDKSDGYHDDPSHTAEHVCVFVGETTSCLVDMRLEESHDGCHEVPSKVDGGEEAYGLDGCLVGEQYAKGMQQTSVFALGFRGLTTGFPFARLIEAAL